MADIPKDLKPGYYTLSTDKEVYDQAVNMNSQQLESWLENNEHLKSEYSEKILDAMKASEKPVTKERLSPEAAAKKVGGSYWGFFDETKRRGTNLAKTLQGYKYGGKYSLQMSKEDAIKQMEKLYEKDPDLWESHHGVKEKEDIREKVDEAWDVVNVPAKGGIWEAIKKEFSGAAQAGEIDQTDYDVETSLEKNPELHQKMNDAADQAQNDYLKKIQSGEIPFPDNLDFEMKQIGNKARHDMLKENMLKGTIDTSTGEILKQSMLPPFDDLRTGWEKLTRAGDKNLADFDITSTMGVETPETPSGLSTDVFTPPAYETFTPKPGITSLGTDYEEDLASQMAFAADPTFETSEEEEEYNEYLSQIAGMPKIKQEWNLPSFKNMRNVLSAAYAGGKKTFPLSWALDAAQGINFPNLRGGLTQRGYEKERQDRINMQRQSNIIKTLQSGKYAPDWEKTAFERVQQLGENLNLVDAADVGLTRTSPAITTVTPRHAPHPDRGGGGGNVTPGSLGMSRDPTGGSPFYEGGRVGFSKGGIANLWRELSNL